MEVQILQSLETVDSAQWDSMVSPDDPFFEHAFLAGLESSACVGPPETGWSPRHIILRDSGELVAAMPLYEKTHSYGEFIFDWAWADGSHRAGIPYYPKLVGAIPFTPVSGTRMLVAPGRDIKEMRKALAVAAVDLAESLGAMSIHLLFLSSGERDLLEECGWLGRSTHQYHWARGSDWLRFDDYLAAMRSRHRKQVRRERREAAGHDLTFAMKSGVDLCEEEWHALWRFYLSTISRKWSTPYLNQRFFKALRETISDRIAASFAYRAGKPVAGSLFFTRGDGLYGRYWGSVEPLEFLHFELCYYLPIEWALENGITRFETGAQGEHKIKRGFLPEECCSAHWFRHPAMMLGVQGFLRDERNRSAHMRESLEAYSPYRERPIMKAPDS